MASVQSTRATKYASHGMLEDEAPEHLESPGEFLIKELVQKQTNTQLTLEQQLKDEKKFERGVGFVSVNELLPGTSSLQDFEKMQLRAEKIQELERRGLSKAEALAVMSGSHQNKASPAALEYAQQRLHDTQELSSNECVNEGVSRREWELAQSMKPDSVETRLYKFAMQNMSARAKVDYQPPDHPIHQLAEMEQRLIETADPHGLARTLRRKRRQQVEAIAEPQVVHYKAPDKHHSLWDCAEKPVIVPKKPFQPVKIATCKKETLYTVKGNHIVQVNGKSTNDKSENKLENSKPSGQAFVALECLSDSPNVCGRLTEDELKQLPRFQNYERGTVSRILFIKNLSSNVTEADLAGVFAKFQEANAVKIIFRLMTGKMRGQAFVTFKNCEVATSALEATNGIILKGKPMIIQYGRHQT